jgi:hypothetical protein
MSISNDAINAELGRQIGLLYDAVDADSYLSRLGEPEKDELVADVAADIVGKDSYVPKLARSELERNLRDGLDACDPAGFSSGIKFSAVSLGKAEYEDVSRALREEFRNIDADNMDPEDELFKRTAAKLAGVKYTNNADELEAALMNDGNMLAAFGDAYANAEAVYYDKVGGFSGLADIVVPEAKPKPKPEKGLWNWAKRNWKGLGIIGLLGTAGAYGAYKLVNDTPRNHFIDSAKAKGATADEAERIYDGMYKAAMSDRQITIDRNGVLSDTAQSMLDFGLVGKHPTIDTLHGLGNMTVAYKQLGLPALGRDATWLLTNATQKSGDIFDPTPIVLKGVNSSIDSSIIIKPVPAMQAWTTADHIKAITDGGFDIVNHPEMYAGLNAKVIANLWCAFQNPYGLAYAEQQKGNTLTPTSQGFKDLVKLQWDLYSQFTEQRANASTVFNHDFPWYNSEKLNAMYSDKNQMKAALFEKFVIPASTYSITDHKIVSGIEGAKIDLQQTHDGYKAMMKIYPSGTIPVNVWGEINPRFFYYSWLDDRGHSGLNSTVSQYVGGWDDSKIQRGNPNQYDPILKQNGMDQYLTKNWKYWDLAKFIAGYVRGNPQTYGGEVEQGEYAIPSLLRMAGFPVCHVNIDPTPLGAANREWTIGLPPHVADSLTKNFPDAKVLFGPGYTFGLYNSDENSLAKDGVNTAYVFLGDSSIYLKK